MKTEIKSSYTIDKDDAEELSRLIGKGLTRGVLNVFAVVCVVLLVIHYGIFPTDPTDASRFDRSGLRYYKDAGTGKEYISGAGGCLIERKVK